MQPRPPQPSTGSASNFNPEVNSDVPPPAPANYNGTELVMLYDYKASPSHFLFKDIQFYTVLVFTWLTTCPDPE